jgi:excisionase family DNA binding protein
MTRQHKAMNSGAALKSIPDLRNPIYDPKWTGRSTFSVEEAGCEILGLSKCSAYAAAKNGSLPTVRVGRRLIVPRLALEKLLGT